MPQETIEKNNVRELRIKKPSKDQFDYVLGLSKKGFRTLPGQLEMIIEEHREWSKKMKK